MNDCREPLDPIDIEALAAESEPLFRSDAGLHAASCETCNLLVSQSQRFDSLLSEAGADGGHPAGDLAQRVLRLRPFSRLERRSVAAWSAPLLLCLSLVVSGLALLARPVASADVGLLAALAGSSVAFLRAASKWAFDASREASRGLGALAQLLAVTSTGPACLLLLLPSAFALRRVLARAFARR
ncbi:MAG TPA: hypothetical protein VEG84_05435 [Thermoanaerobaculia bacterium]|nr:hypothetical protein [Thermoanaerobaculia bacterium]